MRATKKQDRERRGRRKERKRAHLERLDATLARVGRGGNEAVESAFTTSVSIWLRQSRENGAEREGPKEATHKTGQLSNSLFALPSLIRSELLCLLTPAPPSFRSPAVRTGRLAVDLGGRGGRAGRGLFRPLGGAAVAGGAVCVAGLGAGGAVREKEGAEGKGGESEEERCCLFAAG